MSRNGGKMHLEMDVVGLIWSTRSAKMVAVKLRGVTSHVRWGGAISAPKVVAT